MTRRALLWLVPLFITLHNIEELAGMRAVLPGLAGKLPAWVSQVLPSTWFPPTVHQFALMLLIVTALPYLFVMVGRRRPRGPATMLLAATQTLMLINVASHLGSAAILGGYAPGMVTALVFNLPFSLYFFGSGLRQGWLKGGDFAYFVPIALLLHGPGLLGLTWLSAEALRALGG